MKHRFSWLEAKRVRDAQGRRPTDADYDARTVLVPPDVFSKLSSAACTALLTVSASQSNGAYCIMIVVDGHVKALGLPAFLTPYILVRPAYLPQTNMPTLCKICDRSLFLLTCILQSRSSSTGQ